MIQTNTPHRRRSIRLPGYDYSQGGEYFVTICAFNRENLFGKIDNDEMILNEFGQIIFEILSAIPPRYPQISLGPFVIMPNHVHIIFIIDDPEIPVGAIHESPLPNESLQPVSSRRRMLLPLAIGYLKMNSARHINLIRNSPNVPVWQRNYYEHIITSEKEYIQIETYIENNPANWANDREY